MIVNSSHGTKCAGIIAGAENGVCGKGVAYDAQISGNWFWIKQIYSWHSESINIRHSYIKWPEAMSPSLSASA